MTNDLVKLTKYFVTYIFDDLKSNPISFSKPSSIKTDKWILTAKYNVSSNEVEFSIIDKFNKTTLIDLMISFEQISEPQTFYNAILEELQLQISMLQDLINGFEELSNSSYN
jgi:hypothetical protein